MMPNPATMPFAWEEDVLRCARVLVCLLGFTVAALIGGAVLAGPAPDASPAAADLESTQLSSPGFWTAAGTD